MFNIRNTRPLHPRLSPAAKATQSRHRKVAGAHTTMRRGVGAGRIARCCPWPFLELQVPLHALHTTRCTMQACVSVCACVRGVTFEADVKPARHVLPIYCPSIAHLLPIYCTLISFNVFEYHLVSVFFCACFYVCVCVCAFVYTAALARRGTSWQGAK